LACNFQNNSPEFLQNNLVKPTVQEKNAFLIKKVAFWMIGLLAVGAVGYLVSSTTVPYFIKLAPSLKKNILSPVLDILPTAVVNKLPTGIDVIAITNKANNLRESLRVPYFLSSPFSSDLTTLPERIYEAIEFLGKVEADQLFSLNKYKNESFTILSLMSRHIDSLTALVGESKGQLVMHSGKIILLNEAYTRVCNNNVVTCIRILFLKDK
jgi:preprotein translocase subunit Sss1